MRATTTTFTLFMPLIVYAQNQAQISVTNQQLRGPVLISDVFVREHNIKSVEVATPEATEKVNLIILTESGCPDCQESVAGPLNDMITSPGFADIVNVQCEAVQVNM
eukprot:scaffold4508_cov114-Skeletonema_marinoi.AAC.7